MMRNPGAAFPCSASSSRTRDSERALVSTLAALVPGAMAGIVREVIVADGGSTDETEQVADIAGCRFFSSAEPLGAPSQGGRCDRARRLADVSAPGAVPAPGWIDEAWRFAEEPNAEREPRFLRRSEAACCVWLRERTPPASQPDQGLMLRSPSTTSSAATAPSRRAGGRSAAPDRAAADHRLRTPVRSPDI